MTIQLNQAERDLLKAILQKELEEVRSEFHHTQALDYKERLKEREGLVRSLLERLA